MKQTKTLSATGNPFVEGVLQALKPDENIHKKAAEFAFEQNKKSRTWKAAKLRLACVRYVVTHYAKVDKICGALNVSRRRFFEVCQEIRRECGLKPHSL